MSKANSISAIYIDSMRSLHNMIESNDQKIDPCIVCKQPTKLQLYYCLADGYEDNPCTFKFRVCKTHKNKREKIVKEHLKEHQPVDLI